jgi:hypothetical protein
MGVGAWELASSVLAGLQQPSGTPAGKSSFTQSAILAASPAPPSDELTSIMQANNEADN